MSTGTRFYDYSSALPRLVAIMAVSDPPPYQVHIPYVGNLHLVAANTPEALPVRAATFTLRDNNEGFEYVSYKPVPMPTHPQAFADLARACAEADEERA